MTIDKQTISTMSKVAVTPDSSRVTFRKPQATDGADVWALIRDTGVLDLNSSYCYLMLNSYFRETCVIAERNGEVIGFVSGFILPDHENTLFIWQVAVAEQARGLGVASKMLQRILARDACSDVHFVETTVSPSNAASEAMFRRLARRLGTKLSEVGEYHPALFLDNHESERIFRIGPFDAFNQ